MFGDKNLDSEEYAILSTGVFNRSISSYFLQFQKKSIFYFRFRWRYILVDNRLPYNKIYNDNQTPVLIYGKYRSNDEFWVSLIEKAYAKLHGSDKMNNSNESDKLWNKLLINSTLEHNNKNNKQKDKIISAKYYTRNKTMIGCLFYFRCF